MRGLFSAAPSDITLMLFMLAMLFMLVMVFMLVLLFCMLARRCVYYNAVTCHCQVFDGFFAGVSNSSILFIHLLHLSLFYYYIGAACLVAVPVALRWRQVLPDMGLQAAQPDFYAKLHITFIEPKNTNMYNYGRGDSLRHILAELREK